MQASSPQGLEGVVLAVHCDGEHRFSKSSRNAIRLIENSGIDGDAHAGPFAQHRHLARRHLPNDRQVHLLQAELFDDLRREGFAVRAGALGENITTYGIDLLRLPVGTLLNLGDSATVTLTGLRTPCGQIDRFQRGLKRALIVKTPAGVTFRAGVFGVVRTSGELRPGNRIIAVLPKRPWGSLPFL